MVKSHAMMMTVVLGSWYAVRVMRDEAIVSTLRKICSMMCRCRRRRKGHDEDVIELMEMSLNGSKLTRMIYCHESCHRGTKVAAGNKVEHAKCEWHEK